MTKILRLLEALARRDTVGTLLLGQKKKSFEVFFEGDLVYVIGKHLSEKIDILGLTRSEVLGGKVSESSIEALLISTDLSRTILPESLCSRGLIDERTFREVAESQFKEEFFEYLMLAPDSFYFQEGHVPESVIGASSAGLAVPLNLHALIVFLKERFHTLSLIEEFIPNSGEVFVITEKGMARKHQAASDVGLQRIFDLIDGFRSLESIVRDGFLYCYYVQSRIVEFLKNGWIKMTRLAEVRNLNPELLSPEEAVKYVSVYKTAVKFGADELGARAGLAKLMVRLEKFEEAVIQYNFIGDTFYQMGRRSQAIRAYFEGLKLTPENPLISEKIIRIYHTEAEERLSAGNVGEAVELFRNALNIQPDHAPTFHALFDLYLQAGNQEKIAELCDQAASRSRLSDDATLAVEILRRALSQDPTRASLYKKLSNLYLDFHMTSDALDVMERLARLYLAEGKTEQGTVLIDKILRSDSSRKHLWEYSRTPPPHVREASRRFWASLALRASLVTLLLFSLYQLWSYRQLSPVRSERYLALADAPSPPPDGTSAPPLTESRLERQLRSLARAAAEFESQHPLSVFRLEAASLRKEYARVAAQLEEERNRRKAEVVERIRTLIAEGEFGQAGVAYKALLVCPPTDAWRREALELLVADERYQNDARALLELSRRKRVSGDLTGAYATTSELIRNYPRAAAAREARFPVRVESVPREASARAIDGQGYQTPLVLEIEPGEVRTLSLELPGFEPATVTVEADDGPVLTATLRQRALFELRDTVFEAYTPLIHGEVIYCVSKDGGLYRIDWTRGSRERLYHPAAIIGPIGPAVDGGKYVLLPLNNGQVLRFNAGGVPEGEYKIPDGLIATPLLPLESSVNVTFGSSHQSRSMLVEYDPVNNALARRIVLDAPPTRLARCGTGGALGVLRETEVFRADLLKEKIVWKVAFPAKVLHGPTLAGDAMKGEVLVFTAKGRLVSLDPLTGEQRWQEENFPSASRVSFLPANRRVLVFAPGDSVVDFSLETRKRRTLRGLPAFNGGHASLEAYGAHLGVVRKDGAFVLIDAATLEPAWQYTPTQHPIRAAARKERKLALVDAAGGLLLFDLPRGF